MITVAQLGVAFVKSTRLLHPDEVCLTHAGIAHDRDFFLVEENGRPVASRDHGTFFQLRFSFIPSSDTLVMDHPDDRITGTAIPEGEVFEIDCFGMRRIEVRRVGGPWADFLTGFAKRPIRLARCCRSGSGIDVLPVTLMSTASLRCLQARLSASVDPARFRAGFLLDGFAEDVEEACCGRRIQLGAAAVLRIRSGVPRCIVTNFDPASGKYDPKTFRELKSYRTKVHLPDDLQPGYSAPGLAAYADVLAPGTIRLGDEVKLLD